MKFFATFWSWLNGQLTTYIGDNTARLAGVLEPAVMTLATLYVMAWGYLHLTGKIDEPLLAGVKRIATLALILGVGLRLWLYNSVIVDTFYRAPAQLAAAIVGAGDPVATIDAIWERGGSAAWILWSKGWGLSGPGYCLAAVITWVVLAALCVYAMFLISLSNIALAVLLALGPLFIVSLFFEGSRRFFSAWLAQLANYGLITILTVMIAALLLRIVQAYAVQTAARGTDLKTMDVLDLLLMSVLALLLMCQVMPIAAGLAGGVALNTSGILSRTVTMVVRRRSETVDAARADARGTLSRTPREIARNIGASTEAAFAAGARTLGQRWQRHRR